MRSLYLNKSRINIQHKIIRCYIRSISLNHKEQVSKQIISLICDYLYCSSVEILPSANNVKNKDYYELTSSLSLPIANNNLQKQAANKLSELRQGDKFIVGDYYPFVYTVTVHKEWHHSRKIESEQQIIPDSIILKQFIAYLRWIQTNGVCYLTRRKVLKQKLENFNNLMNIGYYVNSDFLIQDNLALARDIIEIAKSQIFIQLNITNGCQQKPIQSCRKSVDNYLLIYQNEDIIFNDNLIFKFTNFHTENTDISQSISSRRRWMLATELNLWRNLRVPIKNNRLMINRLLKIIRIGLSQNIVKIQGDNIAYYNISDYMNC